MSVLYWVIIIFLQGVVWLLITLPLWRYAVSEFSAKRLAADAGGKQGATLRWLFRFRDYVAVLRFFFATLCILITLSLLNQLYMPWPSLGILLILLMVALLAARLSFMANNAEKLLFANVQYVQKMVQLFGGILKPFTNYFQLQIQSVDSYEEFLDHIRRLPSTVLNPQQKLRIETVLSADSKVVKDIMTLKKRVVSVEPAATLGPILLSDLEKSGHGFFPVATKKGEPEGILELRDIADIHDAKKKVHVRELMKDHIVWVADDTDLIALTDLFLKAKQHILFVRSPEGEFSGIVTIADLIKHLVGIVAE